MRVAGWSLTLGTSSPFLSYPDNYGHIDLRIQGGQILLCPGNSCPRSHYRSRERNRYGGKLSLSIPPLVNPCTSSLSGQPWTRSPWVLIQHLLFAMTESRSVTQAAMLVVSKLMEPSDVGVLQNHKKLV